MSTFDTDWSQICWRWNGSVGIERDMYSMQIGGRYYQWFASRRHQPLSFRFGRHMWSLCASRFILTIYYLVCWAGNCCQQDFSCNRVSCPVHFAPCQRSAPWQTQQCLSKRGAVDELHSSLFVYFLIFAPLADDHVIAPHATDVTWPIPIASNHFWSLLIISDHF